ncbi:hypothetical protein D9M71_56320 [compost metagenome]
MQAIGDGLAVAVVQARRIEVQLIAGEQAAPAVVQGAGGKTRVGALECAALIVQGAAGVDVEVAAGNHAAAVTQVLRSDCHVALRVAAVVQVDASFDDASVGNLRGIQRDALAGGETLAIAQVAIGVQLGGGAGISRTVEDDGLRLGAQTASGAGLRQAQLAVGIDLDIAGAGGHVAGQLHAHTLFGAHQTNRPGVHATQRGAVDGQLRLGAAVIGLGGGGEGGGVHLVAAGHDRKLVGVDIRVELGAAGDQLELVDVAGIQAGALNTDAAAVDVIALQLAIGDDRLAGGQRCPRGVDEAAAVAGDAIGVGDDDVGGLAGDFGVALQLRGAAAGDFAEDLLCGLPLEVRVADNDAAQLSVLGLAGGVVEDQALLADVVVAEFVVRQPGAIGRGDIDHRHAVAGRTDAGIATRRRIHRQLCRCRDDGVEDQDAGECAGDGLVQRMTYVHVGISQVLKGETFQKKTSTRK